MVTFHEGERRNKVQVGWIVQQTELILALLTKDPPQVNVAKKELAFMLAVVERQRAAENAETNRSIDAYEEATKDFGW